MPELCSACLLHAENQITMKVGNVTFKK